MENVLAIPPSGEKPQVTRSLNPGAIPGANEPRLSAAYARSEVRTTSARRDPLPLSARVPFEGPRRLLVSAR